ncbi:MAG: hypothetical protein AAB801_01980 [Patescibacteria group bacterium]
MTAKNTKIIFLLAFSIVGFIFLQIPFSKLLGSNVSFTRFDFFGPMAGAFLGPALGIISVFTVEISNLILNQTPLSTGVVIRLFPMLFSVAYFGLLSGKKSENNKWILIVPIIAIALFIAHPIGRTVWYYSLFWTIPIFAYFKKDWLLARSLGATFTAHAVGGAAWIWAFNLPASVWQGLIPIVIQERLIFALGIAGSYLITRKILRFLASKSFPLPATSKVLIG